MDIIKKSINESDLFDKNEKIILSQMYDQVSNDIDSPNLEDKFDKLMEKDK